MADFERLIRGAINAKKASTPTQRRAIYNSSRHALKRLIEQNRSMTVEAAIAEQRALEEAISRIEDEFSAPPPASDATAKSDVHDQGDDPFAELKEIIFEGVEPAPSPDAGHQVASTPPPGAPAHPEADKVQPQPARLEPAEHAAPVSPEAKEVHADAPAVDPSDYEDRSNMPLEFARRRRKQKLIAFTGLTVIALFVLGWLGYLLYIAVMEGAAPTARNGTSPGQTSSAAGRESPGDYINILEAGDLSALVTSNRGEAEIVRELNMDMVRVVSVRDPANLAQAANPILLKLQPGVLEQISGKTVTFEIYAKSGSSSPAQFTVKCQFGGLGDCGRKRFRVGLQPEASIFAFDFNELKDLQQEAFIAISTDTTAGAQSTGRGDVIDIVYARMRAN